MIRQRLLFVDARSGDRGRVLHSSGTGNPNENLGHLLRRADGEHLALRRSAPAGPDGHLRERCGRHPRRQPGHDRPGVLVSRDGRRRRAGGRVRPSTASFVPVPGTEASGDTPRSISGASGVYEARGRDVRRGRDLAGDGVDGDRRRRPPAHHGFPRRSRVDDPRARHAGAEDREPHDGLKGPGRGDRLDGRRRGARSPTPSSTSGRSRTRSSRAGRRSSCSARPRTARASSAGRRSRSSSGSRRTIRIVRCTSTSRSGRGMTAETQVVNKGAAEWLLRRAPGRDPGDDGAVAVPRSAPTAPSGAVGTALRSRRGRRRARGPATHEGVVRRGRRRSPPSRVRLAPWTTRPRSPHLRRRSGAIGIPR